MSDADLFLSGGAPGQKFPKQGFKWGGTVISWEMSQKTDLDSGELKFWPDGKPQMQLIMTLQGEPTGVRYEGNAYNEIPVPDDDGVRRLFISGSLQSALGKALRDAGNAKLEVGAYVEVTRGKDLPPTKKGFSGRHTHTAVWTPANKNPHAATAMLTKSEDDDDPFAA